MLSFVGVGPGDPELMTVKAVRLLREADAIACADTGRGESVALRIAAEYIAGKPLCPLDIPMRGRREDWEAAHAAAARKLLDWLERFDSIAYPVLGDPGIYASSSYLFHLIASRHPCAVVPGVPSFCAGAAALGRPLVEQGERLTLLDACSPADALPEGNVVVMKCGRSLAALGDAAAGREAFVVRRLGMAGEWAGPLADLPDGDEYSYYTTGFLLQPHDPQNVQ